MKQRTAAISWSSGQPRLAEAAVNQISHRIVAHRANPRPSSRRRVSVMAWGDLLGEEGPDEGGILALQAPTPTPTPHEHRHRSAGGWLSSAARGAQRSQAGRSGDAERERGGASRSLSGPGRLGPADPGRTVPQTAAMRRLATLRGDCAPRVGEGYIAKRGHRFVIYYEPWDILVRCYEAWDICVIRKDIYIIRKEIYVIRKQRSGRQGP